MSYPQHDPDSTVFRLRERKTKLEELREHCEAIRHVIRYSDPSRTAQTYARAATWLFANQVPIERMILALMFYANRNNYVSIDNKNDVWVDLGERARAALEGREPVLPKEDA